MEIYNSEQEQVDALKAWWDKNGRSALAGLAVVLLSVLGWQAWNDHRNKVAEGASAHYQQLLVLMQGDTAKAMESGRALVAEYPGTIYAVMSSLAMAKLAVAQNDLEAASAHLRSAMEKSDQPELAQLARLRLARIEFAQGNADAALATLDGGAAEATAEELRGDILRSQGKADEARAAYGKALDGYSGVADKREMVQLKINDLTPAKVAQQSGGE